MTPSGSNRPKECRPITPQDHKPPWPRPQMGASHLLASASHRLATTSAWRLRGKWKVTARDCGKHSGTPCPTSSWRSCFETVFATLAREQADGLLVNSDVFFTSRRDWLVALTARHVPLNLHFGGDEMSTEVPNASARSSSRVSQRMRVYRKRRRQGLRSVRILLPVTDIDYFTREVLTERQRQRPDALETGLAGLIQQILDEIRDGRARVTGNDAVTGY